MSAIDVTKARQQLAKLVMTGLNRGVLGEFTYYTYRGKLYAVRGGLAYHVQATGE